MQGSVVSFKFQFGSLIMISHQTLGTAISLFCTYCWTMKAGAAQCRPIEESVDQLRSSGSGAFYASNPNPYSYRVKPASVVFPYGSPKRIRNFLMVIILIFDAFVQVYLWRFVCLILLNYSLTDVPRCITPT